ncbi:metallophosphoesterase [[Clostridium] polysaccharolyticum]|uniref:Calcineurin-like phosphoesterase domain-containing protein n=1 Tax=[Clostridium] polysaccharolyticum TaxID=29364 RepID=A0A1I0AC84_9FIRM|nr:metallophosphoesterase [[Clostridium] polysaccharolyticum]SES91354.1 hypothetical protein SAMN04487772_10559 [[Clostridium] polysaccharolyticum]
MRIILIGIFICTGLLFLVILDSIYCNKRFQIISYDMRTGKKNPPVKIVFLTDLHSRLYGKDNSSLLEAIKKQKPDLILIGGDMFVKAPNPDMSVSLSLIKELVRISPVYYANGNHEKKVMDYWEESKEAFSKYREELNRLGVTYLINQSSSLFLKDREIEIIGLDLELFFYKKFWQKPALEADELKKMVPERKSKESYRVLLAHNPKYFPQYDGLDVDLVLSGHVHGGIMILPIAGGVLSPDLHLFPKYDFGLFRGKNANMILSKGLGVHNIKFRVFNKPELTVIQI